MSNINYFEAPTLSIICACCWSPLKKGIDFITDENVDISICLNCAIDIGREAECNLQSDD